MAERVYWHVGLPKTGTTYLQQVLWDNRELLAAESIVLPGAGHREHLWAALDMQDDPSLEGRHPDAAGAWERLCSEIERTPGTAILSHEFFCAAQTEQAARAMERLAPAEVHLVITARDAASMLAAGWQEDVKNGATRSLRRTAAREERAHFGWWVWDLETVLRRWLPVVDASRIHVVPVPDRSEGADQHWLNFARAIGIEARCEMPQRVVNQSIGVVQIEALRKVNAHRTGFDTPFERGEWLRGYLGEDHLARQRGDRLRLGDDLFADASERSARAVRLIEETGIDVVGDLQRLRGASEPAGVRTVRSVTRIEVADALAELVGTMLHDVQELKDAASARGSLAARAKARMARLRGR